ncbi:hypothetical protein M758_3G095100, partial [Ceratodon purpureus]
MNLIASSPLPQSPTEQEASNVPSLSILLQTIVLGSTFVTGHIMRRKNILILHEAGIALLLGVVVGLMIRFVGEQGFGSWINFNNNFFFYVLLPPIIFESGWSLKPSHFFSNFGAICTFAFLGTLMSTFVVGTLLWVFGFLGWTYAMPFLVSLTFGALISATDPVTVLAIFNELQVDADLYAYVFGESVLNDAVAIVTYRTLLSFVGVPITGQLVLDAFVYFIGIFVGSLLIGILAAITSALLFKYGHLQEEKLTTLESCLVVLFPYASYMLADGLDLSGIVAILFAGIAMKYYTAPNLSPEAIQVTTSFFQMLAKLSETFVFIYMGVALFLEQQSWHSFGFTFFTVISCLIARIANVYPCSWLTNLRRPPSRKIPIRFQHALWFSGLRGAMAFALALQSVSDLPNGYGQIYLTSTLFTIFFTVLFIGGSTPQLLKYLDIECHVVKDDANAQLIENEEDNEDLELENLHSSGDESKFKNMANKQKLMLQKKIRQIQETTSFATLDKKYIKPFLASNVQDEMKIGDLKDANMK